MGSLEILKSACDRLGQREVARRISRSVTAVNQTLHEKYPNPESILELAELVFGHHKPDEVRCPVIGEIHVQTCERYRTWAESGKIHTERMYRMVRDKCMTCERWKR